MEKHEKFLKFNDKKILFLNVDGTYWIALRPILEALNLDERRYLKKTRRDLFFSSCLDNMSMQVEKNGNKQVRKVTCLPEQYIYGWICFLNSDNSELIEYKKTCYNLLYQHFHGTITNRKELILERKRVQTQIYKLKQSLSAVDVDYQRLKYLENQKKKISNQLNTMDKEIVSTPGFWDANIQN